MINDDIGDLEAIKKELKTKSEGDAQADFKQEQEVLINKEHKSRKTEVLSGLSLLASLLYFYYHPYEFIGSVTPSKSAESKPAPASFVNYPAAPQDVAQPGSGGKGVAMMIADDDAIIRMLLKKFIGGAGYSLVEAVDGEDALGKIADGPVPDLLVTDSNMPGLNGTDLIKGVRTTLGLTDIPIIMLTA